MELTLSREYGLLKLLRLLDYPCRVFLVHTGQDFAELFRVALCHGANGALILGRGIFYKVKLVFAAFLVKGVARAGIFKLDGGTDGRLRRACRRES